MAQNYLISTAFLTIILLQDSKQSANNNNNNYKMSSWVLNSFLRNNYPNWNAVQDKTSLMVNASLNFYNHGVETTNSSIWNNRIVKIACNVVNPAQLMNLAINVLRDTIWYKTRIIITRIVLSSAQNHISLWEIVLSVLNLQMLAYMNIYNNKKKNSENFLLVLPLAPQVAFAMLLVNVPRVLQGTIKLQLDVLHVWLTVMLASMHKLAKLAQLIIFI